MRCGPPARRRRSLHGGAGLLCLAGLALLGCVPASAAEPSVVVDGTLLAREQPPLIREGRVLLPLRAVFESLGASVSWEAATRKIEARRGERRIALWVGTPVAQVDGVPVQLDIPPLMVGGLVYVPLRFPAEALGGKVVWDNHTKTAFVYGGD